MRRFLDLSPKRALFFAIIFTFVSIWFIVAGVLSYEALFNSDVIQDNVESQSWNKKKVYTIAITIACFLAAAALIMVYISASREAKATRLLKEKQ